MARKFPQLHDREWLHERYVKRGMTMREIAEEIGCVRTAVPAALKRCDIPSRGRTGPPPVVEIGQRFGSLVVLRFAGVSTTPSGVTARTYACRCDCGNETVTRAASLSKGTDSCRRCINRTHGHTTGHRPTPTYSSWGSMVKRCTDPTCIGYEYWGGRGITVCERWRWSFEAFLEDMGERPNGMTLDRIDVDGHYEPGNVRWATASEQALNRRPRRKGH